jgi:hypothetical protein
MAFARLQLLAPAARSVLVAAPRIGRDVSGVARRLAETITRAGHPVQWLDVAEPGAEAPQGAEAVTVESSTLLDPGQAKKALSSDAGYTIICGGGVLDSAPTLTLASAADVVILVARVAHTGRADLSEARAEIERAGGALLGAILLG